MLLDLRRVKVSPTERKRLAAIVSNWEVLHPRLVKLDDEGKLTPELIAKMLKVEASTRRRLVIAARLLGVYHRLAKTENERHLAAALAG